MYDSNFFRDVIPQLATTIPAGHLPFLTIQTKSGSLLSVDRIPYVGTGYVVIQVPPASPAAFPHLFALAFEEIAFVGLTSLPPSESPPEGQSESGFQFDPRTAN